MGAPLRVDAYTGTAADPVTTLGADIQREQSRRIAVVDRIASGVEVRIFFLTGGVGLGEAAELGAVVAGAHRVQARRVQVGAAAGNGWGTASVGVVPVRLVGP
jgi:hypothetical protein